MPAKLVVNALSTFFLGSFLVLLSACGRDVAAESSPSSLEGTYKLVSRDLPDGTKQFPPDVVGLITYTKEYRNLNVYWKDADGKHSSISYVGSYKLTDREYSEKSIYYLVNDETGGKKLRYDLLPESGTAPVRRKNGRIEFTLPLWDGPKFVFEGNKFTAIKEGAFVDHWERVK